MQTMNEKLNHDEVLRGSPSGKEATSLLDDFTFRVLRFEEMHRLSSKLISGYQQELEKLRRPPLDKSSSMLKDLLKSIPSSRMARYQEADCHHVHSDQQSLAKLNVYTNGLREHISGAQSIVEHLEKLVEKVTGLMDADLHLLTTENELENTHLDESSDGVEQVPCPGEPNAASWRTSDFAILMSSILSMLEKDLQMQALVVADLSLDVDSDRLQTYAQMWSLRPFVDDALLHQALGWSYNF